MLNPASAEPLVWPSPLKFISELNQEAKALLENALMEANKEREKNILKGTAYSLPSPSHSDVGADDNISEVYEFLNYIKYQSKFKQRAKLLNYLEVLEILNMKLVNLVELFKPYGVSQFLNCKRLALLFSIAWK